MEALWGFISGVVFAMWWWQVGIFGYDKDTPPDKEQQ